MMNKVRGLISIVLLAGVIACGTDKGDGSNSGADSNSPKVKSFSGTPGSCEISVHGDKIGCIEYSYSGELSSDPASTLDIAARNDCRGALGVFTEEGKCSRHSNVGYCKISKSVSMGDESVAYKNLIVFDNGFPEADARKVCSAVNGTFSNSL